MNSESWAVSKAVVVTIGYAEAHTAFNDLAAGVKITEECTQAAGDECSPGSKFIWWHYAVRSALLSGDWKWRLSDSTEESQHPCRKTRNFDLHPPGFKVLISRINKLSSVVRRLLITFRCGWKTMWRRQEIVAGVIRTKPSGFLGSWQGLLRQHDYIQWNLQTRQVGKLL